MSSSLILRVNNATTSKVDANIPSTLPITMDVGVEEIVELCVDNVGVHTIRSEPGVVGLDTVTRSGMRLLSGSNRARTRPRLCGAR